MYDYHLLANHQLVITVMIVAIIAATAYDVDTFDVDNNNPEPRSSQFREAASGDICDDGVIESITRLENGSIAIFRNQNVWLLDKTLVGPYPESQVFDSEFTGVIESAVTILAHESVTQFIGTGLYLNDTHFLTYRNFRPYQIDWGTLVYMPHKGLRTYIGSQNKTIGDMMGRKIMAAYFDPLGSMTKFVFADQTVFGYRFDLGAEFTKPLVTNVAIELAKYGVQKVLHINFRAAFTLSTASSHELFLFNDGKYCTIEILAAPKPQSCNWSSAKRFLKCDSYTRLKDHNNNGKIGDQSSADDQQTGIHSRVRSENQMVGNDSSVTPVSSNSGNKTVAKSGQYIDKPLFVSLYLNLYLIYFSVYFTN